MYMVGLCKLSIYTGTFDSVGSTELQDAGKAGLVTVQGKISAVLGTVLICKLLQLIMMILFCAYFTCK